MVHYVDRAKAWAIIFFSLANFWIWRIFGVSIILGIAVLLATFFLSKKKRFAFIAFFSMVLFFQWSLTNRVCPTCLSPLEYDSQQMRLKQYPPLQIPLAYWIEARPESIALFRIEENFFKMLNLSFYFFGREKFPLIYLPLFFIGLYKIVKKGDAFFICSLPIPIVLISFIGNQNPLSYFSLFPFFIVSFANAFKTK